jgi:peptide/nickel transport system substrate-binding protein
MKFFPNLSAYRLIFLISLLFIFSCSPKREDTIGSLKIFRYNEPSGIASLDPAYAKDLPHIWACNQLYNGLVSLNPKLEVIPAIAKNGKFLTMD